MDISFLSDYMMPVIVGICLCVGWIIKKWVKDVDNKYIPTICAVLGVGISIWIHWPGVTPESILVGLFSGLASTGLHQAVTKFFGGSET